ncbi:MAG: hypothetical protein ACTSYM_00080 [Candidatus Baldrarchaeia archaeon]
MRGYLHILLPNGTSLTFEKISEENMRNIVRTLQIPYNMPLGNITVWAEVWDADGAHLKTQNITIEVLNNPPMIGEIFLSNATVEVGGNLTVKVDISDLEGQIKFTYIVLKVDNKALIRNLTLIGEEYVAIFSYDELKQFFGGKTSKNVVFEVHAVDMDNGEAIKTKTSMVTIVVEEEGGGKPQFPTITVTIATITVTAVVIAILLYRRKLKLKT